MRKRLLVSLICACSVITLASADTAYTYDDLGRLTSVTYDNGIQINYVYDVAGNRQIVTRTNSPTAAPIAADDSVAVTESIAKTFDPRVNDTDADSALTVVSVANPSHGSTSVGAGGASVTYTPTTGYVGTDSFVYTVSDGQNHTASATITATVTTRNPVATNDAVSTAHNTTLTFNPLTNDTDPDGDALTVYRVTAPSHGTASLASSTSIRYVPATGYTGPDSFAYTVYDGHGGFDDGSIAVTVTTGNTPPVAVADNLDILLAVHGPTTPTGTLDPRYNDTDADHDNLTITGVTNGAKGTVSILSGTSVRYQYGSTVHPDFQDTDTFTYTISDGFGGSATATVTVVIDVWSDTGTN